MSFADSLDGAVVSFLNYGTGTALDLTLSGGAQNGNRVISFPFHGKKNQQWKLEKVQHDGPWPIFMIRNVQFNTYVDLYNGGSSNGTHVNGWSGGNNGNPHQLWRLVTADTKGRVFIIQNVGTNTCVDLSGGSANPRTPIQGWTTVPSLSHPNQLWRVVRMD